MEKCWMDGWMDSLSPFQTESYYILVLKKYIMNDFLCEVLLEFFREPRYQHYHCCGIPLKSIAKVS